GGFSGTNGGGPSIFNPPTSKDLWTLGSNIADGMNLTYSLTSSTGDDKANLMDSTVSMRFDNMGEKWNIDFKIQNGSSNSNVSEIHANFSKNQLLITDPITEQDNKFLQPVEASILEIRDIAREPKYLVVGAVWDKIFTGSNAIDSKIQSKDTISTAAGTYDVFTLQYKVAGSLNTIYINKDLPLPVKAQVYGDNSKLLYEYELQSVSR
ncbi:MAG: hypothetical protein ACRD9Q_07945, partial [Nitrososphaeraceae archaeon]